MIIRKSAFGLLIIFLAMACKQRRNVSTLASDETKQIGISAPILVGNHCSRHEAKGYVFYQFDLPVADDSTTESISPRFEPRITVKLDANETEILDAVLYQYEKDTREKFFKIIGEKLSFQAEVATNEGNIKTTPVPDFFEGSGVAGKNYFIFSSGLESSSKEVVGNLLAKVPTNQQTALLTRIRIVPYLNLKRGRGWSAFGTEAEGIKQKDSSILNELMVGDIQLTDDSPTIKALQTKKESIDDFLNRVFDESNREKVRKEYTDRARAIQDLSKSGIR